MSVKKSKIYKKFIFKSWKIYSMPRKNMKSNDIIKALKSTTKVQSLVTREQQGGASEYDTEPGEARVRSLAAQLSRCQSANRQV